jgi:regulator of protease activity HflC (stomatin/prohibitin superfamily)
VDAGRLREAIQSALDGLDSGIEVVGLVGAPAVAGAGDEARAAAITGQALVAQARSAAEIERAEARQTAAATVAGARAKAAEMVAAARSGLVEFTADRAANQADSKSFLLERYFANLSKAIGTSPKTIIDHRLNWPTAPELDLRPPAGVGVPGAASGLGKGN